MKRSTKRILGIGAASVLAIGIGASALAGGGYGPGWGMNPGMMGGPGGGGWMMGGADPAATQQWLSQEKAQLGITPAQEQAWSNYATAMTTRAALMNSHRQARFGGTVTPGQMQTFHQQGISQMQQMITARRDLYAALTPQQRASFSGFMGPRGGRW